MKLFAFPLIPVCLSLCTFALAQPTSVPSARPTDFAKDKNLYVVGYSHLDTEWRWTYEHTIRKFIPNTMRDNFPLLDKYPGYLFNFTGSRRYEFMKEYYPEDYAKVKEYVAKGRWFPAGSSVDESDAIVPSLESLVRTTLYGNRFFDREFGVHSDEFMLPDCFGFPASLPSVLAHAGVKGFSTQKLTWKSAVGIPFKIGVWEGPDGKSVVAALDPGDYAGRVTGDLSKSDTWRQRIENTGALSGVFADFHYFGTGDRGGAPDDASVAWIEKSLHSDGPVRVISGRADQLVNDLTPAQKAHLPRYKGELLLIEHSTGSITSQAYMKRWNRKNELLANAAERAAVAATWFGALPYPRDTLYRAWDLVLGSQMHDILPGTSLPEAYEFSWNDEVLAGNFFSGITAGSSAAIISALDTQAQGVPLVIYNPLSIGREDVVEAEVKFPTKAPAEISVFDGAGAEVPAQIVSREGKTIKLLLRAKVPPVGYASFDVRPGKPLTSALKVTPNSLENERYKVALNENGDVSSIFDKAASKELLRAPMQLGIHTEIPVEKPAWHMDWSDRQKPARAFVGGAARVRIVENGPARVALEVTREIEGSVFVQQIRLASGNAGQRVEFATRIDWNTRKASLRASFPLTVSNPFATYDSQLGTVARDNNNPKKFEHPQHQWFDLTDAKGDYGVAVLNDSKYGSDKPDDSTVRLTLLHTPGWRSGQTRDQETQDLGRHETLFALAGHRGDWADAGVSWQAARLNQPLIPFVTTAHPGSLGRDFSLLSLNTNQVEVVAVKLAEDNDELIVRVRELTGKPAKSVRLALRGEVTAAREVDGQEHALAPATLDGGALVFDLTPYSLKAFSLKLGKPSATVKPVTSQPVPLNYDLDVASTDKNRADGDLDGRGSTYPAEQLPATLVRDGVTFRFGPTTDGAKNALVARGQTLALPAGFNRVYLLAASADGDRPATVRLGDNAVPFTAQAWNGFIGQWDNRLWASKSPAIDYIFDIPMTGLVPGFVKPAPVAWFATHYHTPADNTFYRFSYVFKHGFDLPPGATTLTLPTDERIRILAVSVAREPGAGVAPAAPLFDTLSAPAVSAATAPTVPQAGLSFTDFTTITVQPPLYYRPGDLRYTLDGSEPAASSPVYVGPIEINRPVTLKVRQILPDGTPGPVVTAPINVEDKSPPRVLDASVQRDRVEIVFSEPLDPTTAKDPANYRFAPALAVSSVTLGADARRVTLLLEKTSAVATALKLELRGLRDTAPKANVLATTSLSVVPDEVYRLAAASVPGDAVTTPVANLPLKASQTWTLHAFVKTAKRPTGTVYLGGFGTAPERVDRDGHGRFLALAKDGIRFITNNREVQAYSPIDLDRWQLLTVVYDGRVIKLYKDARPIESVPTILADDPDGAVLIAPITATGFKGELRTVTIQRSAATQAEIKTFLEANRPAE